MKVFEVLNSVKFSNETENEVIITKDDVVYIFGVTDVGDLFNFLDVKDFSEKFITEEYKGGLDVTRHQLRILV